MDVGHFYFIDDTYFIDFPDGNLMRNGPTVAGVSHGRPCFYSFYDLHQQIYWVIPISSKVSKYRSVYSHKIKKYGSCDTLAFGLVLGVEKAFLIQNMCPVTPKYISSEYYDQSANIPVRVNGVFERELKTKAKRVLALQRKGLNLIFPDVRTIESELLKQLGIQ